MRIDESNGRNGVTTRMMVRRFLPVVVTVVVGVLSSISLYAAARGLEQRRIRTEFERLAGNRQRIVHNEIQNLVLSMHGYRAFYAGNDNITKAEFNEFLRQDDQGDLDPQNGGDVLWRRGVKVIAWLPRVADEDRREFETRIAPRDGVESFRITWGDRPGPFEEYYPVYFVEPPDNDYLHIGEDLYSNLHYYDVARQAANTSGQTTATSRTQLEYGAYGVEFLTPVLERDPNPEAFIQREKKVAGLVLYIVDIGQLIDHALGTLSDTTDRGIHTFIIDQSAAVGDQEIFTRHFRDPDGSIAESLPNLRESLNMRVGLRNWTMTDVATPHFIEKNSTWQPLILMLIILGATVIIAAFIYSSVAKTQQASQLAEELKESHNVLEVRVQERTSELAEASDRLQKSHDEMELRVQEATEELRRSHDDLELRVEERTAEARKAAEEAEAAREEVERQSQAMMEMSTPVIRLWQGIVLVPLIGVLDTRRSAQMNERLLQAVVESGAKVAILDVTGVPVIDTSVARHIITAVNSAKILGAEVVVTGFSPDAAQTLAQLGVDFSQLRTRGSLRAGVADALRIMGTKVIERS